MCIRNSSLLEGGELFLLFGISIKIIMKKIFSFDSTFANFMNALASVILVGILWLITSIPIITMGAASCAAYDTTVNVVRKGRGYVISYFLESFRCNLLSSLFVQIISIVILGLLSFDCIYLYGYGTEFSQTLSYILYVFLAFYFIIVMYIYPIMQRFDESPIELFKLAFYITFRHLLTSLIIFLILVLSVLAIYFMPWSIIVVPGINWFLQSLFIERIISRFSEMAEEEDDEDEDNKNEDIKNENNEDKDNEIYKQKNTNTVIVKRRRLKSIFRKNKTESLITVEQKEKLAEDDDEFKDKVIRKN